MVVSGEPGSLIELQRSYIVDQIKRILTNGTLCILIIDDKTESIINRLLPKEHLLRIVTTIDKIDGKRKKNNYMEAIYFVESSIYNFKCIVADVQTQRYKAGHSLFSPLTNSEADYYFNNKFLANPAVIDYFNQGLNVHFIHSIFHPVESRVFLTDDKTPNSMPIYYNENCSEFVIPQIRLAAQALVNLMVVTGEYPLIRFYCPPNVSHQASRLSELIADEFQNQIDEYAREHHEFPPELDRPRSVLLIVDRTLDLYAPLLHDFSYQAMAMDIVPSLEREGVYRYKVENEAGEVMENESSLQNEKDEDWINLRHLHIIEASELIINKINELIKNNPLMIDRSKATTSSDLMYVVANLKGFDEERKQITLHKSLIDECLDLNASRKLAEFAADFEQTCAAGGTSFEGVRNKCLHDDLIVLLARDDLHVNDKMRLVLIYGLYRGGLIESDFVKLVKFIGVNDRQIVSLTSRCFNNFHKLGYPIVKKDIKDKPSDKEMFHTINNEGTYNTSRFAPGVQNILQKASKNQLDEEWFPYFRDKPLEDDIVTKDVNMAPQQHQQPTLRNTRIKASWAQSSTRPGSSRPKQRVFCYIAGGMTYGEMKSVYELSSSLNKEFYVGSESILKPRDFLIGLQSIDKVKHPQDLDLNLLNEATTRKEPPLYLFESDQRMKPLSGTPVGTKPGSSHAPGQFPPQVPPSGQSGPPPNHSVPSHYQKRTSVYVPPGESENTEKKKSRFKRLFK